MGGPERNAAMGLGGFCLADEWLVMTELVADWAESLVARESGDDVRS